MIFECTRLNCHASKEYTAELHLAKLRCVKVYSAKHLNPLTPYRQGAIYHTHCEKMFTYYKLTYSITKLLSMKTKFKECCEA